MHKSRITLSGYKSVARWIEPFQPDAFLRPLGFSTRTLAFRDFSLPRRRFESLSSLPPPFLSLSLCLYFRGHSFGNYRCRSGTRLNAKENFTRANSSPRSRPVLETRANDARSVTRARFQEKMVGLGGCASNLFVFGKRFRSRQTETRIPRESTPVFLYRPWYYQRRSFANTLFDTPLSDRACSVPYFDTQGDVYAYRPSSTSEKHRYTADVRCWTLDVQRASLAT